MSMNKPHINPLLIFLLAALTVSSCIKDISNEIPQSEPKITVNSFFNPRFPIVVSISKSGSILDTLGNNYLPSAKGYIFENEVLVDSLQYYSEFNLHIAANLFVPQSGNQYRIQVQSDGLPSVTGESVLPDSVQLGAVQLDTLFTPAIGKNTYHLRITLPDPSTLGDLYHLMIYRNRLRPDGNWYLSPLCFETADNSIQTLSRKNCSGAVFSDAQFNGQNKEILINTLQRTKGSLSDSLMFVVELRTCSQPYYDYNRTLIEYKNGQGDIFAQPAPVLGNIQNGYGIFGGYAPVTDTVKLN